MIDGPVGWILFRDPVKADEADPPARPAGSASYFRARERAERAAAERAASVRARWAHQELAQHYALRAADSDLAERD